MRKKAYQINIPSPCDKSWEAMTPNQTGRHCSHCERTVVDFTGKTDRQILLALEQAKGQRVCGRLSDGQMQRKMVLESPIVYHTKWKAFALMLSGILGTSTVQGQQFIGELTKDGVEQTTSNERQQKIQKEFSKEFHTVTGIVMDENEPLIFAAVVLQGTTIGISTDMEGKFSLRIPHSVANPTLVVSYVGFQNKTVELSAAQLKNGEPLEIILSEDYHNEDMSGLLGIIISERYIEQERNSPNLFDALKEKIVAARAKRKERKAIKAEQKLLKAKQQRIKNEKPSVDNPTIHHPSSQVSTRDRVIAENPNWIINVSPNPFDNQIDVTLQTKQAGEYKLVLFDASGREVHSELVSLRLGENKVSLQLNNVLFPAGNYFLSVLDGEEVLQTKLMVKVAKE